MNPTILKLVLEYIDESFIALRMSAEKKMIHFSDLGIVGVLINSKNINGIKKIAKQELGPLYNLSDAKMYELIKTLICIFSKWREAAKDDG